MGNYKMDVHMSKATNYCHLHEQIFLIRWAVDEERGKIFQKRN